MKRMISVLLLITLFVVFLGPVLPQKATAVSVRNRKIVSVVCDDSGSMDGEKWEYTNYAMQCFAAMLNKEDRLDITYMSTYQFGAFSVDTGRRAESVEQIRKHTGGGGTPVEAVDTAFAALKAANDSNENTQYWLIVMTDGQMNGAEERINRIAESKMPNGTKPHIVFLTLCDTLNQFTPAFSKSNIENRSAKTADEIISVISDIASSISGRYPLAADAIKVINDTTVEITSDLPLVNIGILSQRSKASVLSVVDKENNQFKNEGNVPVAAPGHFPSSLPADAAASLNGNVALFSSVNGNIPAGTYTITFSEAVDKKDLIVMVEPAFELRLEIFVDGTAITDVSQLMGDTTVDIEASLYEIGTDNKIAMSMLPSGYQTSISCSESGKVVAEDNSLKLQGVQLKCLETEITAKLEVPGFFTTTDLIRFTPRKSVLSDMTTELHYDGSERLPDENGNVDPDNVIYIDRLDTNETGIAFRLELEGSPVSRDQALAMQPLFEEQLSVEFPAYDVTVTTDGRLIVTPRKTGMMKILGDLVCSWLYGGEKTISCTYDGITATGTLSFKLANMDEAIKGLVIRILIVLAGLYLILWIFVKHHFCKQCRVCLYRAYGRGKPYERVPGTRKRVHWLTSSGLLNFLGLGGMRVRIKGMRFYVRSTEADGYRVEGVKGMIVSTGIKYPSAGHTRCQDRYKDFNNSIYIFDGNQTYYKISVE